MSEEFPEADVSRAAHSLVGEEYDHLFQPVPDSFIDEAERQSWPQLEDFQKKWFAPPEPDGLDRRSQKGDGGRTPTEESLQAAYQRLLDPALDVTVKTIIKEHAPEGTPSEQLVALIRENALVREELARYFLSKVKKNLLKVPERIAKNTIKNPNHSGYPRQMYSSDYAALLAISELDGTYKRDLSAAKGTLPEYDARRGEYVTGQHQAAADFLLFNRSKPTLQ